MVTIEEKLDRLTVQVTELERKIDILFKAVATILEILKKNKIS